MVADHTTPWEPPRREGNLLLALLGAAALCLLLWRLDAERRAPDPEPTRITAQGRIWELQHAVRSLATSRLQGLLGQEPFQPQQAEGASPWDRALLAVLAAEDGNLELAESLAKVGPPGAGGDGFRRCFLAAYLAGKEPSAADRSRAGQALRNGHAARLLEARLAMPTDPASAARIREAGRDWALPRLAALAAAGLALLVLVPAGIAVALVVAFSPRRPRPTPIPSVGLSGRVLGIVLLGWLMAFLLSGAAAGSIVYLLPFLRPFAVPLTYASHAVIGIGLLCRAEGLTLGGLLRRLMPGSPARSLAWGFGFLAVAVVMVLAVSLVASTFIRPQESPQQQLMDVVADTRGALPLASLVLTVSLLAPAFEECLFRGTLLPWLGHRLQGPLGRRSGWILALLATSLGFGLIHFQPAALPVLSTLGFALGLAFLHTRNLLSSILVHGLWNGGVFVFYRVVLG